MNKPFSTYTNHNQTSCRAVRVIGLLIAICRGVIDEDIIDCVFDEEFTSLVYAPPVPKFCLLQGEAQYMKWEGRIKTILNARRTDRYSRGWNDDEVVTAVEEWEQIVLKDVADSWYLDGEEEDGRLKTETHWYNNVLLPWAERTRELLQDYRGWRSSRDGNNASEGHTFLPPLESIDHAIPPLFEKVLFHLREADKSGLVSRIWYIMQFTFMYIYIVIICRQLCKNETYSIPFSLYSSGPPPHTTGSWLC